jgi:hypothetical protein
MESDRNPATRRKVVLLAAAIAVTAVVVALSPADMPQSPGDPSVGEFARFLYFHGALTWVNLATFTLAAVAAIVYLVRGSVNAYRWASAWRYVSLLLWIPNTWMGFESMRRMWGAIKWDEPRLAMSIWILLGAILLFGIDFSFHRWKLTAALDGVLAGALWYGVVTVMILAETDFHPDSPVFNSSLEVKLFYLAMTLTSFVAVYAATSLLKDRLSRPSVSDEAGEGS